MSKSAKKGPKVQTKKGLQSAKKCQKVPTITKKHKNAKIGKKVPKKSAKKVQKSANKGDCNSQTETA